MELFGRKKKKEDKGGAEVATTESTATTRTATNKVTGVSSSSVIVRPYVTEKAAIATDDNVYTFVVTEKATKPEVKKAIKEIYKKTPVKVAIVKKPAKRVYRRDGIGTKAGLKKAYVYLKKGETIDII